MRSLHWIQLRHLGQETAHGGNAQADRVAVGQVAERLDEWRARSGDNYRAVQTTVDGGWRRGVAEEKMDMIHEVGAARLAAVICRGEGEIDGEVSAQGQVETSRPKPTVRSHRDTQVYRAAVVRRQDASGDLQILDLGHLVIAREHLQVATHPETA